MDTSIRNAGKALYRAGAFIVRGAIDLVYPPHCMACGIDLAGMGDPRLCAGCRSAFRPVENPCPTCATPLGPHGPHEPRCTSCRGRKLHFDEAAGAFLYEGPVKRLLHRLKFEGFAQASLPIAAMAHEAIEKGAVQSPVDVVVPVPLHWLRRVRRGFNQSERIATHLAKHMGIPSVCALVKFRPTDPQVDLSRKARYKNPLGSFEVNKAAAVAGKNVLLVDDVMTTAATISECARALKEAGASRVVAFTVARQD
jgi:ComF family protein